MKKTLTFQEQQSVSDAAVSIIDAACSTPAEEMAIVGLLTAHFTCVWSSEFTLQILNKAREEAAQNGKH